MANDTQDIVDGIAAMVRQMAGNTEANQAALIKRVANSLGHACVIFTSYEIGLKSADTLEDIMTERGSIYLSEPE